MSAPPTICCRGLPSPSSPAHLRLPPALSVLHSRLSRAFTQLSVSLIYTCRTYLIKHRREYGTAKSCTTRMILECRQGKDKCKWELQISKKKTEGMWRITKYEGDRTCEIDIIPRDNVHFNKYFIGMGIRDLIIQEKLRFSPYAVQALMRSKYGYKISYKKAWKS
ncbi:hypothetical protein QQ045_008644 [Rhodiola kirilowii]